MAYSYWSTTLRAAGCTALAITLAACGDDEPEGTAVTGSTTGQPTIDGGQTTGSDSGLTGWDGATTQADATVAAPKSNMPCDVQDIVYEHCLGCHSDPPQGTYMPLLTHAHFHAASTTDPARAYYEVTKDRINAPVGSGPMPPTGSSTLTPEELATLNAWIDAGAPASDAVCSGTGDVLTPEAGVPQVDAGPNLDEVECVKFLAHAPGDFNAKYQVGAVNDQYVNMTFAAPWDETVYGITINPIIDNGPILHHWLLYYETAGAPDGAVVVSNGAHTASQLVHGWAPGGSPLDFSTRGDVGMEMKTGSYLMEFHYNSTDAAAADASGAEVCFKRRKPENVATMSWLGLDHGIESYVDGALGGTWNSGNCNWPSDRWVGTCRPANHQEPIHLMVLWPHMHEAGVRMSAVINSPSGERPLHNDVFDFDYQKSYEVDEVLMPGETITTTCEYSKPSCAGQATSAEMCYLYTYAWPAGALQDFGPWGTLAHGSNVCLGQ